MSRTITRWLTILGILLFGGNFVAPLIFSAVAQAETHVYDNGWIFLAFGVPEVLGLALLGAAGIGALIKLAQLQQYPWFWVLLGSVALVFLPFGIFGIFVPPVILLVYSFIGPTTPAVKKP